MKKKTSTERETPPISRRTHGGGKRKIGPAEPTTELFTHQSHKVIKTEKQWPTCEQSHKKLRGKGVGVCACRARGPGKLRGKVAARMHASARQKRKKSKQIRPESEAIFSTPHSFILPQNHEKGAPKVDFGPDNASWVSRTWEATSPRCPEHQTHPRF